MVCLTIGHERMDHQRMDHESMGRAPYCSFTRLTRRERLAALPRFLLSNS